MPHLKGYLTVVRAMTLPQGSCPPVGAVPDDTESASGYWGASRKKRLEDCPRKFRDLYRRAWSGNSRKAAVRAHCLECVGWSAKEVALCTAPACPLYEFRLKG